MTDGKPSRPLPMHRHGFRTIYPMATRLNDMDAYGHMNNAVFVEYFDSAVNRAMIERGVLDMAEGDRIGVVVHGDYDYFAAVTYPEPIDVAVRVAHVGGSSATWEFAMFRAGEDEAAAQGRFTHVYVDRANRRPLPLTPELRAALVALLPAAVS